MKQTIEHITKTAKRFDSKIEFRKNATAEWSAAYRFNKKNPNFINKICSHMKSGKELREKYRVYTKTVLLKEAKKYKTRNDFRENSTQYYKALLKMDKKEKGLMDKACKHMKSYKEVREYPIKEVIEKALECNTRSEFKEKHNGHYRRGLEIAKTKGNTKFMDKICSHMIDLVTEREKKYTRDSFIPLIRSTLRKHKLKFKIHYEYKLNKNSRIDLIIEIKGKEIYFIPVEVKHDYSEWSEKSLQEQIRKYNQFFKEKKNTTKTFLVSPKGRYGESEESFIKKINDAINNKTELDKPNYVENPSSFKNILNDIKKKK